MRLPRLLRKPLHVAALSAGALFGASEAKAQQPAPVNPLNPRNEIFGRGIIWGPGPFGVAGTLHAQGYWAPIYNQQIQNPSNGRLQGQTLSRPPAGPSGQNSGSKQVDPGAIEKQKRIEAILEQVKHAKTSPDETFKYVLNINGSKYHLIIPQSEKFQLPEMKEILRVKFSEPARAGTPYFYLVTNDTVQKINQEQQKSPSAPSVATVESLKKVCCPCK
jgi:hypothetical protein